MNVALIGELRRTARTASTGVASMLNEAADALETLLTAMQDIDEQTLYLTTLPFAEERYAAIVVERVNDLREEYDTLASGEEDHSNCCPDDHDYDQSDCPNYNEDTGECQLALLANEHVQKLRTALNAARTRAAEANDQARTPLLRDLATALKAKKNMEAARELGDQALAIMLDRELGIHDRIIEYEVSAVPIDHPCRVDLSVSVKMDENMWWSVSNRGGEHKSLLSALAEAKKIARLLKVKYDATRT